MTLVASGGSAAVSVDNEQTLAAAVALVQDELGGVVIEVNGEPAFGFPDKSDPRVQMVDDEHPLLDVIC